MGGSEPWPGRGSAVEVDRLRLVGRPAEPVEADQALDDGAVVRVLVGPREALAVAAGGVDVGQPDDRSARGVVGRQGHRDDCSVADVHLVGVHAEPVRAVVVGVRALVDAPAERVGAGRRRREQHGERGRRHGGPDADGAGAGAVPGGAC